MIKRNSFYLITILIIALCSVISQAQPKKFGEISKDDFSGPYSQSDSSYSAVIIFDKADYTIQKDFKYLVERHTRIHILTDEGLDLATYILNYNTSRYDQRLERIEGLTYNLNERNKIEKTKLDRRDIEYVDLKAGWKTATFTMPKVTAGSIIDIRYEIELKDEGQLPNWYFEGRVPKRWSEINAEIPLFQRFDLVSKLARDLDINRKENSKVSVVFEVEGSGNKLYGGTGSRSFRLNAPSEIFYWGMKNVQPLTYEPYISSINNFRSEIFFQVKGIEIPEYQISERYTKSWQQIAEYHLELEYFGEELAEESSWSKNVVQGLGIQNKEREEQIQSIFEYVNSFNIEDDFEFYLRNNLKAINDNKSGTPNELNLLLVKLIKDNGINAYPVLISTVDNGRVNPKFILPDQFNRVITLVESDGDKVLLDAASENQSILLPVQDLNGNGLVLDKYESYWHALNYRSLSRFTYNIDANLKPDGSLEGELEVRANGYEAEFFARVFEQESESKIKELISSEAGEVLMDSTEINPIQFYEPSVLYSSSFKFNPPNVSTDSLKIIYFQPPGFEFFEIEDLQNPYRKYPIEFPYRSIKGLEITINIPEGYVLSEEPEDKTYTVEETRTSYTDSYIVSEDRIKISRSLVTLDPFIPVSSYEEVKAVINAVNQSTATLVFEKSGSNK